MASWFTSSVSIDEQVEKATSESLPTGEQDLGLNLEICDLIRSKTVLPKDAMRSLKRRLLNKNPNVKIATLHLIDTCIKNGGSHFLQEVASREFMDSFKLVLLPPSGVVNKEVQGLMLEYLQNWANAFEGQIQLNYVTKVYNELKSEGFSFPERTKMVASFIDTSAPPEWVDSDTCMKSGEPFTMMNRKHHCRNCGGVYLQKYCNNYIPLPHYGINEAVRVCDDCFGKLESKKRTIKPESNKSNTIAYHDNPAAAISHAGGRADVEDEELKRALALSLEESKHNKNMVQPSQVHAATPATTEEEDDEDMKAAIAASLADMNGQKQSSDATGSLYSRLPNTFSSHNANGIAPQESPKPEIVVNPDEFSALEEEVLYRYCALVEAIQTSPGSIIRDTKLQQLNDSVTAMRPKLARTLGSTIDKYEQLVDMHGKLTTVVRFYDKLLEDRLSRTYISSVSPQHSGYYQSSQVTPIQYQPQQRADASYNQVNPFSHPSQYAPSAPPPSAPPADSYYPDITSPSTEAPRDVYGGIPPPHQIARQETEPPHQDPANDEILIEL